MNQNSPYIQLHYYEGFGGSHFDSVHWARAFRHDAPYNFGMQVSQLFSASTAYSDKVFTNLTMARGNYMEIPNDIYKWTLKGDDTIEYYVTELLYPEGTKLGLGRQKFKIALDKGYLESPSSFMLDDNRYPFLEIIGTPVQKGESYIYEVQLQTENDADWIPTSMVNSNMRLIEASSSVVTEMNQKGAGISFTSQTDLQCQIGAFARKMGITDKFIRKEIYAVQNGQSVDSIPSDRRLSQGFSFALYNDKGEAIEKGAFLTKAEEMLLNRIEMDRELAMVFGKQSTRIDPETGYLKRTGPGYRELVLDGEVMYHNGSLTLKRMEQYFADIFLRRIPGEQRKIKIATGEGGMRLFHQMINNDASSLLQSATKNLAVKETSSTYNSNSLQYGYQFTKFVGLNGIEVELIYDPMKDNHQYCGRKHPENPKYTIDSFRFDIYDFGSSDGQSNMMMLCEKGVESYAFMSTMVDPRTGVMKNGEKVANFNKGVEFFREMSGALWIKDVSRIGSIIYEPEI